jgi:hypothetical protein
MKRKIQKRRGFKLVKNVYANAYHLTPTQRAELLIADVECDDPNNLISHEEAVKQIEKWLNKPARLTPEQEVELEEAIAETYDQQNLLIMKR